MMGDKKQTRQTPRRRPSAFQGKIHIAEDFDDFGPWLREMDRGAPVEDAKRLELQILAAVKQRFGSDVAASNWYRTDPLPGFSGATAEQLVHAGRGEEVLLYIEAIDAGIHS